MQSTIFRLRRARNIGWLLIFIALIPLTAQSPVDNGIHVGEPKIYDSRALTLMLDDLAQSLRKTSFVDPKALASALGNLQGFRNDDFSQAFQANGAVGSQAASVFSGAGGVPASPPLSGSGTPPVSITFAPTMNAGSTAPPAASSGTPLGPQPPALPTLQTAPSFTPNFGSSAPDLLSDEVNLTYQFDNIRMLLDRSLSDRLLHHEARLQAVIGFDVDIEPTSETKDAVAVVEATVTMSDCDGLAGCDSGGKLSLVAMMPEEGSHNAATLSQKANAFGGAIASSVFSVGYSAQKRSQVFFLYRDMDTVSFQKPSTSPNSVILGWQFRPVLGRRSVSSGMRHMMAVMALPSTDVPKGKAAPKLTVGVKTSWVHYDGNTQTIVTKSGFWAALFGSKTKPDPVSFNFPDVRVPTTDQAQWDLRPQVTNVKWVRSDAATGVAIVSGENFFPETTIRFGSKNYSTPADGLVIKSDQQLEVTVPLSSAVAGGVLSGRYGEAKPLEARDPSLPAKFRIKKVEFSPTGNDMYEVDAFLNFMDGNGKGVNVDPSDLEAKANPPVVSVNGTPLGTPSYLSQPASSDEIPPMKVATFVPATLVKSGPVVVTVTFPFSGMGWSASLPHYDANLKVVRLGGKDNTRLLISGTDDSLQLCAYRWKLVLDQAKWFENKGNSCLTCADKVAQILNLDMTTAVLKQYHRFVLINEETDLHHYFPPLVGEIPSPDPPPPGPAIDKDQKVSVSQYDVKTITFKGKNLDQVKKVLFDKAELQFTPSKDGKTIVIVLSAAVTAKPRNVELQLISDDNDPVTAPLTVTAAPAPKAGK
jgi:hypothetical protein